MKKVKGGAPFDALFGQSAKHITRSALAKEIQSTVARLHDYPSASPAVRTSIRARLDTLFNTLRDLYALDGEDTLVLKDDGRKAMILIHKMLCGPLAQSDLNTYTKKLGQDIYMAERLELRALSAGLTDGNLSQADRKARWSFARDVCGTPFDLRNEVLANETLDALIAAERALLSPAPRRRKQKPLVSPENIPGLAPPEPVFPVQLAMPQPNLQNPGRAAIPQPGIIAPLPPQVDPAFVVAPPPPLQEPVPSFARQVNEAAVLLHTQYSTLKPSEQHALFRKIVKELTQFATHPQAQAKPGEAEAMARELQQLAYGPVGVLRKLDKESRQLMKNTLGILGQSTSPDLSKAAKFALAQMVPTCVREGLTGVDASKLLAAASPGTFVVGSNPYPGSEYSVYVTTPQGVEVFVVTESAAQNGSILYQYRGGAKYTNFLILVEKELKSRAGLEQLGESPPALVPAAQHQPYTAPPPTIEKGIKFDKKTIGKVRVSRIVSENGNEYVVSNTQARGAFGKFRYAVDLTGKRWAIKEFRSEFSRHKPHPKTNVTNMDEIKEEIKTMQKVGASVTVTDVMNINGKVYAVMPIMSGELGDIGKKIKSKDRRCVTRSVLRQMAQDLDKCHQSGYVHRDIKPPNALWDTNGKVAVSDFGLATKAPTGAHLLTGFAGTPGYMAPELHDRTGYNAKADTWSLALSVAEMHIDYWDNPFGPPCRGSLPGWHAKNFIEFEAWRRGLMTPGGLDTGRIGRKKPKKKWDTYFAKLLAADPVLCEYMLTHMLVTNPARRATMNEVRAFMDTVQSATSPEEMQANKAFNKLGGDTRKKDTVFKVLEREL